MNKCFILTILVFSLWSCRKEKDRNPGDENPPSTTGKTYEKRLQGSWTVTEINYTANIPSLATPVNGQGEDPEGEVNFSLNPQLMDYDVNFTASIPFGGTTYDVPFNQQDQGTWKLNDMETRMELDLENNTFEEWEVVENQENFQVFRAHTSYAMPLMGEVDIVLVFTVEKDM